MYDQLRPSWQDLLAVGGSRQLLVGNHPLRIFFGADESSRPVFILVTEVRPPMLQLSEAVDVHLGDRGDGTWALALTLLNRSMVDTFIGMCLELIRRSGEANNASESLNLFFETLRQWRELLERDSHRLSVESLRGLVGELSFAINQLASELTAAEVVSAWRGPYGAPQDFVLSASELFEVKAVQIGARTVQISSTDQLDPTGVQAMALVLVTVSDSDLSNADCVTLSSLLTAMRALPGFGAAQNEELAHRLSAIGVDEADDYYAQRAFAVGLTSYFQVRAGFPRILRDSVPSSIDKVEYRIRLTGMRDFEVKVAEGKLWRPRKEDSNE